MVRAEMPNTSLIDPEMVAVLMVYIVRPLAPRALSALHGIERTDDPAEIHDRRSGDDGAAQFLKLIV